MLHNFQSHKVSSEVKILAHSSAGSSSMHCSEFSLSTNTSGNNEPLPYAASSIIGHCLTNWSKQSFLTHIRQPPPSLKVLSTWNKSVGCKRSLRYGIRKIWFCSHLPPTSHVTFHQVTCAPSVPLSFPLCNRNTNTYLA